MAKAIAMPARPNTTLYTADQKTRRDASRWTTVQAVLAPLQFAVFLVSLGLVVRYLVSGEGLAIATGSVVLKTSILYLIMVTGAIWEKEVFGQYLFADVFFWEDVVSMAVIALHTLYLVMLFLSWGSAEAQLLVALAGYTVYVINAGQFLLKLRAARLGGTATGAEAAI